MKVALRELGWRFLRVVAVLVLAATGAVATTFLAGRVLPRPSCADSVIMERLTLLTGAFAVLVVVISAVRVPANRHPREAIISGLIIVSVIWFPFCTHWPPFSVGFARGAMRDMRTLATSLDAFRRERGRYPIAESIAAFNKDVNGSYPATDPWGQPYVFQSSAEHYVLVSYGDCGKPDVSSLDAYQAGPTVSMKDDIVMRDGVFVRHPSGMPDYRPEWSR